MSALDRVRREFNLPMDGADKGAKSPSVSSVSSQHKDFQNSAPSAQISKHLCCELTKVPKGGAGLAVEDLQGEAGTDWDWLQHDEQALRDFADAVLISRARGRGEIPAHYTATTTCRGCGPVPIFPGVPETVDLCPWCWNRVKGLPMPRAPK